jgi:hypothetical protein
MIVVNVTMQRKPSTEEEQDHWMNTVPPVHSP